MKLTQEGLLEHSKYPFQNTQQTLRNSVLFKYCYCSGYMSPEYAMEGFFSEKSDVFSLGVIFLEIISGRRNSSSHKEENNLNLLAYVSVTKQCF